MIGPQSFGSTSAGQILIMISQPLRSNFSIRGDHGKTDPGVGAFHVSGERINA